MVNPGKISQIIGPVVDVAFEGAMPPVYEKLIVQDSDVTLEVFSHIKKGVVRCIALTATEGLARGAAVVDTGADYSPCGRRSPRQGAQRFGGTHR